MTLSVLLLEGAFQNKSSEFGSGDWAASWRRLRCMRYFLLLPGVVVEDIEPCYGQVAEDQ